MEIPEINMITDFEAGMKCLQNPSLISRFDKAYSFWKWGALCFAVFATFNSLITRIKLILIRFHTVKPSPPSIDDIFEFSEDDETSSPSSDDDDERETAENRPTTSFGGQTRVDGDFSVNGGQWFDGCLRRRGGKSVVKLWDSLGFNLDFDDYLSSCGGESVVSTWEEREISYSGGAWGFPAAVLTAESSREGGGVILGGYDGRMSRRAPVLYAEWGAAGKVAGVVTGGVGKVYVRDGGGGVLAVGDVRNVRRPLERGRECDGETWWDADAVIAEDE